MARLWARLLRWGERLGIPPSPSLTPLEQAGAMMQALPDASDDLHELAVLYARSQYSPHHLQDDELNQAQFIWLKLRGEFIRAWLHNRLRFIQRFQR